VEAAGVPCHIEPRFHDGSADGYTTILASYSEDDMATMLEHARTVYREHDLGEPTSFRAGGWTADASTLRALARTGYRVDSSAVPAHHLEEWRGVALWDWTTSHWEGIATTTQPYWPGPSDPTRDASATGESPLSLLEVPDNGALVDYVTGAEMTHIFDENFPAAALGRPTLYQVGFHPPNFSEQFLSRMQIALGTVDDHLHSEDRGPAVYVRISDLLAVYPAATAPADPGSP
jgi:hypothetical protein